MILEKLYRGKVYPGEQVVPVNSERYRREAVFDAKRQRLLAQLDEPLKKDYLALLEEANAISACDCEQSYIEGMCMGARLTAELLLANEWD